MADNNVGGTRAALITGASAGIGRAIAVALAREGFDLALTDLDAGMLANTLADPALAGRKAVPLALDLRSADDIPHALAHAARELGAVDVLVNNAGRPLKRAAVEVTWAEWDDVLAINLKGAFFLSTAFARSCLDAQRPGAIVNIASTHGLTGLAGRAVYGISKGGMIQMTRMLAIEWAQAHIRVNAVAPATVLTPSREALLADPGARASMLERIPQRRFPAPAEIAAAVAYLASPAAASVTGQVLAVDGGLTAA